MEQIDFSAPDDLVTVFNHMEQLGASAQLLAGGTDLMVAVNLRRKFVEKLIYLGNCGLDRIEQTSENLVIGAAATLTSIVKSELVNQIAPLLVDACKSIGSPAIRNMATLGGNVCNASPAADGALALLALDAGVAIVSSAGERSIPINTFFTGPGQTVLKPNELVKAFTIPLEAKNSFCGWSKIGQRKAEMISIAAVAVSLQIQQGKCQKVGIALGAVAPTPLLAVKAAGVLEGQPLNEESIEAAAKTAAEETRPIDDPRASAWYRKRVVKAMVARVLGKIQKEETDGRP